MLSVPTRATIRTGENRIDGIPVDVTRKRIRRINVRVTPDGRVHLSVPTWWATLREGEDFLRAHWEWVLKTRAKALATPAPTREPVPDEIRARFVALLGELHAAWSVRTNEPNVAWKLRRMSSIWGSCHWRKRVIVYNLELARAPRELVEYVVAHEFAHFQVHDHGPCFRALMDARLPDWRNLRRRLNARAF